MALSSAVVGWLRNAGVDSADINNVALSASKSALLTSMLDVAATNKLTLKILPDGQGGGGSFTDKELSIAHNLLSGPALALGSYLSHELGHALDPNGTRYLAERYSIEQASVARMKRSVMRDAHGSDHPGLRFTPSELRWLCWLQFARPKAVENRVIA